MSRTKAVNNASSADSSKSAAQPPLLALTPIYDASSHEVYFNAIEAALTGKDKTGIRNIALSGSYGVGKSSILQMVAEKHKKEVVQISLSTIGRYDKPESSGLASAAVVSKTNRIQKEIVKQLLYREDPAKMPGSRYHRIGKSNVWRQLWLAALVAVALTLVFYLAGWTAKLLELANPYYPFGIAGHLVVFIAATGFMLALGALFHNRIRIEKFSAGAATISLSAESTTFFDEYLDEIVYFFEVTGRNIVIFEDIDRFDDPHIFETLRALNTLLNGAKQLSGHSICFIYAIKDSIFDELGIRAAREEGEADASEKSDAVEVELARVNRTKFFDLIIPVVPFVTHRSARDLMFRVMSEFDHDVSDKLIDLAARHLVDMRLIKNVRNEFVIFRQKVLGGEGSELKLSEGALFAMMLYKSTHLSDFEAIKVGKSKLDRLYGDGRRLVAENIARLAVDEKNARQRLTQQDSVARRSEKLGAELLRYIERLERHSNVPTRETRPMVRAGQTITEDDLQTAGFWQEFLSVDSPLEVPISPGQSGQVQPFSISRVDAAEALGDPLSLQDWQESDRQALKAQLEQIMKAREFLMRADMGDLMDRDEFTLKVNAKTSLSLRDLAARHLDSGLARQLVEAGYIDRNFTLYASTYYAERVSSRATNFIIHNVDPNVMDVHFALTSDDVEAVLRERGESVLRERGMYNVNVLDHMLEAKDARVLPLIKSLTTFAVDEQAFLESYFIGGQQQAALVQELSKQWGRTFAFIISEAEVDESVRIHLLNIALEIMVAGMSYIVNDEMREYFEGHYSELAVFASDTTSAELATLIARLLKAMNARLSSLGQLSPEVRHALVVESRYTITRCNLVAALDGVEDLALDQIRDRDTIVYGYILGNLSEYLVALREIDPSTQTIETADAFKAVIEDVLEHAGSLLPEVVASASPNCRVPNLVDVSEAAWPVLADDGRFPTTVENVITYISAVGQIDTHLAALLRTSRSIEVADGDEVSGKTDLAQKLLSARDTLSEPDLRTKLVVDLRLEDWLPTTSVQPEPGELIGLLVDQEVIEDDAEAFALSLNTDWGTREFAISKSKEFVSFMTPTEVPVGDVAPLMRSDIVPNEVKNVVLERAEEFTATADRPTLTAIAEYAIRERKTLPPAQIARLACARVETRLVLQLLERLVTSISLADLTPILEGLGGDYATVSTRNGKRPKLPNTELDLALVRRLVELKVVSSYDVLRDKISVNMKKGS